MKVFLFELKKIAWTKKFLIILIVLISAVAFLFIRNILFGDYAEEQKNAEVAFFIERSTSINSNYNRQLERLGSDEEIEGKKELNLDVLRLANELRSAMIADNWETKLFTENQLVLAIRDYKETGEDYPLSESAIDYTLAMNHTLLNLGIPPEYENYSIAHPNFLKQVVDLLINYGGLIIVLLLIGEILTREFENRSINLLFTLPLNRSMIIWSKYFSALLVSCMSFAFVVAAGFGIGRLLGRQGSFAYPVLVEKAEHFYYMPIGEYIWYTLLLFIIMLLFVIALYLFYSLVFKYLLAALLATLATIIGGYQLGSLISWAPFDWINPFQYVFPQEVILYQNDQLFYQGIPITLLLTFILLIISSIRIKKEMVG